MADPTPPHDAEAPHGGDSATPPAAPPSAPPSAADGVGPAARVRPAAELPPADPAQQSLSDALRVSFGILRIAMVILLVIYLFSGIYQVGEREAAVVTRFGQIVTDADGNSAKDQGLHFGWPFPIDNVIYVPTDSRSLDINDDFVYEGEGAPGALNPERDGSLITGDANLVHARFTVEYQITDPAAFIANFGDPEGTTPSTLTVQTPQGNQRVEVQRTGLEIADDLVRNMVESGIVHAVASVTADQVIRSQYNRTRAIQIAQQQLDGLDAGITVNALSIRVPEMPVSVRDAYTLVTQSEATRSTLINTAESDRTRLLGEAGGKAALPVAGQDGPLVALLKEYELATSLNDSDRLSQLDEQLQAAFTNLEIVRDDGTYDLGGETATLINEALIERSRISEQIKTEAQTVRELADAYAADPQLFKERRWQYVVREIFGPDSGIELFYSPSGQRLQLEVNRDPDIQRNKERARLDADMEENAAR